MGVELVSGLCVTNNAPSDPLETILWDAQESRDALTISVKYGGATSLHKLASAPIPWGSTDPVPMVPSKSNPHIAVVGTVRASWLGSASYVVTFSGGMIRPNLINITSSDQNGVPADGAPIIVAAYLDSLYHGA
jgi:hypothetical protein